MKAGALSLDRKQVISSGLLDAFALLFVFFVPTISHLFSYPVYVFEPMRIMVILAIAHTHRKNVYLLALTLPLFSFLVSAHPHLLKSFLISFELLLNVWLFYALQHKIKNIFAVTLISVAASKVVYYLIKFLLISALFIEGSLVATPLMIQVGVSIIFAVYLAIFYKNNSKMKA